MATIHRQRRRVEGVSYKLLDCLECKKQCHIPKHRWDSFRFCSRKCGYRWAAANDRHPVSCEICKREFTVIAYRTKTAKYCSRKCYYKAQHLKGSVVVSCRHCGKEFRASPSHKRIYCSRACIQKHADQIPKQSATRSRMVRQGMLKHCERCGFDQMPEILGIHHRDRNPMNNTTENIEILCPNCHSMEHGRHISHVIQGGGGGVKKPHRPPHSKAGKSNKPSSKK